MTKSWKFTLASSSIWYNLWTDLIAKDSSFTDPTFTNAPFVPSQVCELVINPQTDLLNLTDDPNKEVGTIISNANPPFQMNSNVNSIPLMNIYLKPNSATNVVGISIVSK